MPVIVTPAVPLLNSAWIQPNDAQSIIQGPWKVGSKWFAVVGVDAGGRFQPVVQTSTDGLNYTTQYDSAVFDLCNAYLDGTTIYIFGVGAAGGSGNPLEFQTFDCNSLVFGAHVTGGPGTISGGSMVKLSGGNLLIAYVTSTHIDTVIYSGGWGAPVSIDTPGSSFSQIWMGLLAGNNTGHFAWLRDNVDGSFDIRYAACDSSGTFAAASTIYSDSNPPNGFIQGTHQCLIDDTGGAIYLPWVLLDGGAGYTIPVVLRGTPIAAPIWTLEQVDPGGSSLPNFAHFEQRNPTMVNGLANASCVFSVPGSLGAYSLGTRGAIPSGIVMVFDVGQISATFATPRFALWYSERVAGVWQAPVDWFDTDTTPIGDINPFGDNTGLGLEVGSGATSITLHFNLHGRVPSGLGALTSVNEPPSPPGPPVNPTGCVNQE